MRLKPLFGASLASLLAACSSPNDPGGFSGTPAPSPSPTPTPTPTPSPPGPITTAEGLWTGNTDTARIVTGIVLDDGSYYFLYSPSNPTNPNLIAGVIQGIGTSSNGTFTSNSARDINFEGAGSRAATLAATYVIRSSLDGTINLTSPNSVVLFNTTFNSAYDITPSLATIEGTYVGQIASSVAVQNMNLTVSSTGAVASTVSVCGLTGTITPRSRGNVYDATMVFSGPPCLFAGQTLTGIAYYQSGLRALYLTAPNVNRTDGVLYVGAKPLPL